MEENWKQEWEGGAERRDEKSKMKEIFYLIRESILSRVFHFVISALAIMSKKNADTTTIFSQNKLLHIEGSPEIIMFIIEMRLISGHYCAKNAMAYIQLL